LAQEACHGGVTRSQVVFIVGNVLIAGKPIGTVIVNAGGGEFKRKKCLAVVGVGEARQFADPEPATLRLQIFAKA
jgi:hypothetical protein